MTHFGRTPALAGVGDQDDAQTSHSTLGSTRSVRRLVGSSAPAAGAASRPLKPMAGAGCRAPARMVYVSRRLGADGFGEILAAAPAARGSQLALAGDLSLAARSPPTRGRQLLLGPSTRARRRCKRQTGPGTPIPSDLQRPRAPSSTHWHRIADHGASHRSPPILS